MLGAAGLSWLATRLGKHRTLMIASTGYSLGLILIALHAQGRAAAGGDHDVRLGFLAAGFVLLGRAMCADAGDAIRLAKGKHQQGLLYAMMTSVEKIASAFSIGLTFTILGAVGYQAKEGAHNTPAAIHNLELVYILGPIFFVMLGGACYIGYKLDHKRARRDPRGARRARPGGDRARSGARDPRRRHRHRAGRIAARTRRHCPQTPDFGLRPSAGHGLIGAVSARQRRRDW